jgi:mannose-1-phosphate guanylyltransferase/phosphomannomutase
VERVSITIDNKLLAFLDGMVDGERVKSRSQAVSLLLNKAIESTRPRKAMILAGGGRHKTIAPGNNIPRSLLKVNGKTVIELLLSLLRKQGIEEAVILVDNGGDKIISKLKNGEELGMRIQYVWDSQATGSAGAMMLAKQYFHEPFILAYSDVIYDDLNLNDLIDFHRSHNSACTMVLASVDNPRGLGVARMTGARIISFTEKPSTAKSHLVNAGLFMCEPAVLAVIKQIPSSFEKDVLPKIAAKEKLFGYVYSGAWFHVHSQQEADQASKYFSKRNARKQ